MTRSDQMCSVGFQPSWVPASDRSDIGKYRQQPLHIFRSPPVDDIQIPGRRRYSLNNSRGHADHDDINTLVGQPNQDLVKLGFFGCHAG